MLILDHILILHFVAIYLFMYSLPGIIHLFVYARFALKALLHKISSVLRFYAYGVAARPRLIMPA